MTRRADNSTQSRWQGDRLPQIVAGQESGCLVDVAEIRQVGSVFRGAAERLGEWPQRQVEAPAPGLLAA